MQLGGRRTIDVQFRFKFIDGFYPDTAEGFVLKGFGEGTARGLILERLEP